ncbi:MAG: hypothetical protein ACT4PO_09010 [Actinomycetota bacterium]
MSAWAVTWLVVGLVSAAALIAVFVGLVRHLLLLARTLGRFQEEVQPLAQEIAAEAERASTSTNRLPRVLPFGRR